MKTLFNLSLVLSLLGATSSCATRTAKKEVEAELKSEPEVKNAAQLEQRVQREITFSDDLTPDQKKKLTDLHEQTQEELSSLRDESFKLQSLLSKEVISTKYNPQEIRVIRRKMKDLNDRRLTVLFRSVDRANNILGRQNFQNQEYVDRLVEEYRLIY